MEAATIDRVARILSNAGARRGVLRGLGGLTAATVMGTALPRGAAADEKSCRRKERRCKRRCHRKHRGGIFDCGFQCERFCGL